MSKFVRTIDWELLRKQKEALLKTTQETKDNNILSTPESREQINYLDGITHLLDALQDWAVDEEGVAEELVFNTPDRKFICMVCGQATTSTEAYCEGGHLMMGVEVHHKETMPKRWGRATEIFGMDDETLKTYIENQVSIVILNRRK